MREHAFSSSGERSRLVSNEGYKVVAVEANPVLIQRAAERLPQHVEAGRLHLVNAAIGTGSETVELILDQLTLQDFNNLWSATKVNPPLSVNYVARMILIESTTPGGSCGF